MGYVMETSEGGVGDYMYKEIKNIFVQKNHFRGTFHKSTRITYKVVVLIGVSILFCLRKVCC